MQPRIFIDRFDHTLVKRHPNAERIDFNCLRITLTRSGIRVDKWKEPGIDTGKRFLLATTHLDHSDLLRPRNKFNSKGHRVSTDVIYIDGEHELAEEVALYSLLETLQNDASDLELLMNRVYDKLGDRCSIGEKV